MYGFRQSTFQPANNSATQYNGSSEASGTYTFDFAGRTPDIIALPRADAGYTA